MLENLLGSLIFLLSQSKLALACLESKLDQSVLLLGLHGLLTRDNASGFIVFEVALGESTCSLISCAVHHLCS